MIATLVLASAHLAAPAAVESVNFVHGYEKDQKTTYELEIEAHSSGDLIEAEFELLIKSAPKDGKTKATFTYSMLDMGGQDMSDMVSPIEFELTKHGVPTEAGEAGDDTAIIAFVTLLTTYLPAGKLDEGDSFKIKLPEEAASYEATGKFVGMETVDGKELALLSSKGFLSIDGEQADLNVKTYFDPATKRVVKTTAEVNVDEESFDVVLKLKK